MKLILCLDARNGMQFNQRRQSRDMEVCKRILALSEGAVLWMKPASAKLFETLPANARVDENCLENARSEEWCFVEDQDIVPFLPEIRQVYIFRWNRVYPSDLQLPGSVLQEHFQLRDTVEFSGKSHPVITLEVYDREN